MSKQTYYVVQLSPSCYAHGDTIIGFAAGYGLDKAARLCYGKAERVYRDFKAKATPDTPRRFPRVVRVTIETKTITPKH